MGRLGAHVSAAGGVERAFERADELGCDAIQIFVRNPNQWRAPRLAAARVDAFREARESSGVGPVAAHAAYLVNLAARDRSTLERSRRALADELRRCGRLGVDFLVVHPGAHMERGEARGIERIVDSIDRVFDRLGEEARGTRLLLENTAGQGTVLGHRLEQLAAIRDGVAAAERLGICIDTCHAFAAGYPLDRRRGFGDLLREIEELFGAEEPRCFHLNDSRHPRGSRRDRHANVGAGEMGEGLFRRLVRHRRLRRTPMILETPLGEDGGGHRRDLARLRRLASR